METIGFIGTGMMAEATISGMLKSGFSHDTIRGADPDTARQAYMKNLYNIEVTESNQALAEECDVLVLAVKPQYFQTASRQLRPALKPTHRIISIMAGVGTAQIEHDLRCFDGGQVQVLPVVRVMPNTPAMVSAGVTCICSGSMAGEEDLALARQIFSSVGAILDVEESLMNAATGVAGCGPAYVYMMIEALADGGVMMGLPRQTAQNLAALMVKGAAEMVLAGNDHPGELKDKVCSPGGATIEAVYALEKAGLRSAMMEAVKVSTEKSSRL